MKPAHLIIPSAILLIILSGLLIKVTSHKRGIFINHGPIPVDLNKTITNEMSDSLNLEGLDKEFKKFMQNWNITGLSLSVMRNDSLVYSKGYGWADKEKEKEMTPGTILRLASVSKLLTATGIMKMQEMGLLSLDNKVFGENGILCNSVYTSIITDPLYYRITVEHLLRHQAGFTTKAGDPMFSTRSIMLNNKMDTPPDNRTLLKNQLRRKLPYVPGTSQAYSNFGYMILSLIIEELSGDSYEDWMQKNILKPIHCKDMHIAYNYYEEKYPNETRYYLQPDDEPVEEYNASGRMVPRCYGGNDVRALSGGGAWVASTPELARFVASIDGKDNVPDILSQESIRRMTEYFDPQTYSLGWNDTKPNGEWTRTGTLSGTSALIKYFPDGECWIMVTNTSTWKGPGLSRYSTDLFKKSREKYSSLLPDRDMFHYFSE